jgi:NAD(P)H-hydrate epimerase
MSTSLTHQVYKVNQLQQYEADAAQAIGINLFQLMERAGVAVFDNIRQHYPRVRRILVIAGKGNNGGDGYIVARLAHQAGINVSVAVNAPRNEIKADALRALNLLEQCPVAITFAEQTAEIKALVTSFNGDLILDCVFGIGFEGQLSSALIQLFSEINKKNCLKVSVDVPSGLNADLGVVAPIAVKADLTITLIAFKQGLLTGQAANYVGELYLETLGVNKAFAQLTSTGCFRLGDRQLPSLSKRQAASHKGSIGTLLTVGGHRDFTGAICLASEVALRAGAALVSVCCHEQSRDILLSRRPELMVAASNAKELASVSVLNKVKAIVLGPGLGRDNWSKALFDLVINFSQRKVVDADALYFLAQQPRKSASWVLTPHPGEAAILLACTIADIEADRFAAVKKIAQRYGGICVLKGAGTLVSDGQSTWINTTGNPGMASGGMGDVLSGIIGALILQSVDLYQAARLGVYIHGRAADIIAKKHGQIGILASDLYPEIQQLINAEVS